MRTFYLIALIIASALLTKAQNPTESLFKSKNLDGWKVYGTDKWDFKDGILIYESGSDKQYGYLGTIERFEYFILELEIKQVANKNSMVSFRPTIEGTKINEWQVEVSLSDNDSDGKYNSYGSNRLHQIPAVHQGFLKMGEWNKMKIEVEGTHITTWLNGQQMSDVIDDSLGEGKGSISLQVHNGKDSKVFWRNITIHQRKNPKLVLSTPSEGKEVKR